jgi:two-component system chemotaxis sensor kinase CheA
MDAHRQAYKEEAYELLAELETSLLELEETPEDMDLISRVFRAMHTIKGSGAMFGFDDIATFTHEVETVFDMVRNGRMRVSRDLVNLTLKARDLIKGMLDASDGGGEAVEGREAEEVIAGLRRLVPAAPGAGATPKPSPAESAPEAKGRETAVTYRIRFVPVPEVTVNGTNPLLLLAELQQLGHCRTVAQMAKVPRLEELDPEHCHIFWDVILTTMRGTAAPWTPTPTTRSSASSSPSGET